MFSFDAPVLSPVGLDGLARLTRILDGDTICAVSRLTNNIKGPEYTFNVRIKGIDCPEIHSAIPVVAEYAQKAKARLSELLNPEGKDLEKEEVLIHLEITKLDKYALRYIGNVWPTGGRRYKKIEPDVSTILLEEHLAKPYSGKKKEEWTEADVLI